MPITGIIVVFALLWWVVFFAVLPIGVRSQYEDGDAIPGTEEGAPSRPMLGKKVLWATIGAFILTTAIAIILPRVVAM